MTEPRRQRELGSRTANLRSWIIGLPHPDKLLHQPTTPSAFSYSSVVDRINCEVGNALIQLDGIEVLVDCFLIPDFHHIVNLLTDSLAPSNLGILSFGHLCMSALFLFYAFMLDFMK